MWNVGYVHKYENGTNEVQWVWNTGIFLNLSSAAVHLCLAANHNILHVISVSWMLKRGNWLRVHRSEVNYLKGRQESKVPESDHVDANDNCVSCLCEKWLIWRRIWTIICQEMTKHLRKLLYQNCLLHQLLENGFQNHRTTKKRRMVGSLPRKDKVTVALLWVECRE